MLSSRRTARLWLDSFCAHMWDGGRALNHVDVELVVVGNSQPRSGQHTCAAACEGRTPPGLCSLLTSPASPPGRGSLQPVLRGHHVCGDCARGLGRAPQLSCALTRGYIYHVNISTYLPNINIHIQILPDPRSRLYPHCKMTKLPGMMSCVVTLYPPVCGQ